MNDKTDSQEGRRFSGLFLRPFLPPLFLLRPSLFLSFPSLSGQPWHFRSLQASIFSVASDDRSPPLCTEKPPPTPESYDYLRDIPFDGCRLIIDLLRDLQWHRYLNLCGSNLSISVSWCRQVICEIGKAASHALSALISLIRLWPRDLI
ncbi:hypothetical protein TIFTF001_009903 [Ficus carica]|uniref:Uncharacterized protein n=1 Tax=Ficus carica TaxID=3494 RepID=A0AA87ZW39_FICCA|nr:hypothetical protein TIFTF001_009903 [Ficus carica]